MDEIQEYQKDLARRRKEWNQIYGSTYGTKQGYICEEDPDCEGEMEVCPECERPLLHGKDTRSVPHSPDRERVFRPSSVRRAYWNYAASHQSKSLMADCESLRSRSFRYFLFTITALVLCPPAAVFFGAKTVKCGFSCYMTYEKCLSSCISDGVSSPDVIKTGMASLGLSALALFLISMLLTFISVIFSLTGIVQLFIFLVSCFV